MTLRGNDSSSFDSVIMIRITCLFLTSFKYFLLHCESAGIIRSYIADLKKIFLSYSRSVSLLEFIDCRIGDPFDNYRRYRYEYVLIYRIPPPQKKCRRSAFRISIQYSDIFGSMIQIILTYVFPVSSNKKILMRYVHLIIFSCLLFYPRILYWRILSVHPCAFVRWSNHPWRFLIGHRYSNMFFILSVSIDDVVCPVVASNSSYYMMVLLRWRNIFLSTESWNRSTIATFFFFRRQYDIARIVNCLCHVHVLSNWFMQYVSTLEFLVNRKLHHQLSIFWITFLHYA